MTILLYSAFAVGGVYAPAGAAAASTPSLTLVGTFSYPSSQGTLTSVAGINNAGTVVGQATTTSGLLVGFEQLGGTTTVLEYPGAISTDALGINDWGTTVGSWQNTSSVISGFSLSNGAWSLVDEGTGNTAVLGINDSNDFVGWWTSSAGKTQAFVDLNGVFAPVIVPGAVTSFMSGITNNSAQAVGDYTDAAGDLHGFIYTIATGAVYASNYPSAIQTELLGINQSGELSGLYYDSAGNIHGLAKSGTTWVTYNFSGAKSTSLSGITDQGHISGSYVDSSNKVHGLILALSTPTPTPTPILTPTPTPTPTLTPTPTPTPTPTLTTTPTPTAIASSSPTATATATPVASAIKHIIVVFQENRTPDNMFGSNPTFEPGVDIATSGVNSKGVTIPLTSTQLDYCYDLGHDHNDFVVTYDDGKMDGADKVGVQTESPGSCVIPTDPQFKYVDNSTEEIQPYFDIATQYGFANRMFTTQQGPSFPGHQFIFGGTSAPSEFSDLFASEDPSELGGGCIAPAGSTVALIDPTGSETSNPRIYPCFERPTLSDLLDASNISWKYYAPAAGGILTAPDAINHICVPATVNGVLTCTGPDWTAHNVSIPQTNVLTDITNCALSAVSWVIPTAADSDHAGGNDGLGPSWVASIINEVGSNPACAGTGEVYWNDTAIFVTWDDWGGWYDHVPPYQIGQTNDWGISFVYGMRVPLLVVSAYTPPGYVDNTNHDFGSILRFIEATNNLPLIGPGTYADAYADDLQEFFPLTTPRPFTSIAAPMNAKDFLEYPLPLEPADDD